MLSNGPNRGRNPRLPLPHAGHGDSEWRQADGPRIANGRVCQRRPHRRRVQSGIIYAEYANVAGAHQSHELGQEVRIAVQKRCLLLLHAARLLRRTRLHARRKRPPKHKFAAIDFEPGSNITMYGVLVGKASQNISRGQLLSTKNIRHDASPYQRRNQSLELDCAGRLPLEVPDLSWLSPPRRPDRHSQLLDRSSARLLRKQESRGSEARAGGRTRLCPPAELPTICARSRGLYRSGQLDGIAATPFVETARGSQPSRLSRTSTASNS